MGLSTRDLLLVLRAQDMVSGTLSNIGRNLGMLASDSGTFMQKLGTAGSALSNIGTMATIAGTGGLAFFNSATNSAVDWNKEVALASTQAKRVGVSFDDLKAIGKDVGSSIAVDLADINPALFDIFSTIDTNAPGAKSLLTDFSKAAVAGNVDIQDSARLTLAALNAWQLPTSKSTDLLDQQFKLVELGTGTYGEFASALGRAIPSAVGANQTFGDLGGMMAFLTKNGLSTAMSATSAARALDTIAKPKVVKALEDYGVKVKDANGNFRSMSDIITQLAENKGWAKMTGPERKAAFQEIFGTGTIQARRFFDLAIPNYQQLNSLTDQVKDSTGAMDTAYATMADTAAAKTQLMKNKYELLKVAIGDDLMPAKLKLVEVISSLIDKWNSLDPSMRKNIVTFLAAAAGILAIVGPILMVVGGFLMFLAMVGPMVGGAMALIGWMTGIAVVAALLAGAAYLIYKNWDTVGPKFWAAWDKIKSAVSDAWNFIQPILQSIVDGFKSFWYTLTTGLTEDEGTGIEKFALLLRNDVWPAIQELWDKFKEFATWFADEAWPKIVDAAQNAWDDLQAFWDWFSNDAIPAITDFGQKVVDAFQWAWDKAVEVYNWFNDTFGPGFQKIWDSLKENIPPLIDEIKETWQTLADKAQEIWDDIQTVWDAISPFIGEVLGNIKQNITDFLDWLGNFWGPFWDTTGQQIEIAWNLISTIIAEAISLISNNIQLFLNILQGDWGEAWNNIVNIVQSIWEIIKTVIDTGWEFIKLLFTSSLAVIQAAFEGTWNRIVSFLGSVWNSIKTTVSNGIQTVQSNISSAMSTISSIMQNAWNTMVNLVRSAFTQFVSTVSSSVANVLSTIGRIPGQIQGIFAGAGGWLVSAGKAILDGLISGISSKIQSLKSKLGEITGLIPIWKGPETVDKLLLFNSGQLIMQGLETGLESGWLGVRSYLKGLTTEANFTPTVNATATIKGDEPTRVQIINQDENAKEMLEAILMLVDAIKDMPKAEDMAPVVYKEDSTGVWYKQEYSGV